MDTSKRFDASLRGRRPIPYRLLLMPSDSRVQGTKTYVRTMAFQIANPATSLRLSGVLSTSHGGDLLMNETGGY